MAPKEWDRLVAEIATGVWRLRQRFAQIGVDRTRDDLRRAARDVNALWATLIESGVEILDHTGADYDPGQALQVIAFQPTPGIERERILETVKPTVYFESRWIQLGEIIVGTPERSTSPGGHDG
jgi:hypothetical protein